MRSLPVFSLLDPNGVRWLSSLSQSSSPSAGMRTTPPSPPDAKYTTVRNGLEAGEGLREHGAVGVRREAVDEEPTVRGDAVAPLGRGQLLRLRCHRRWRGSRRCAPAAGVSLRAAAGAGLAGLPCAQPRQQRRSFSVQGKQELQPSVGWVHGRSGARPAWQGGSMAGSGGSRTACPWQAVGAAAR